MRLPRNSLSSNVVLGVLVALLAISLFTPCSYCQIIDDDSLSVTRRFESPFDSVLIEDSLGLPAELPTIYPEFYDRNPMTTTLSTGYGDIVELAGNHPQMYFSLCDALRDDTQFYRLTSGPMGQSYGMTFLGLPPYLLRLSPDLAGSYQLYEFPIAGMNDLRLFSLEQGDVLIVDTDDPRSGTASLIAYRRPHNANEAYADLSIHKGNYSYSNTDVIFKQRPGSRFGWGFNAGVEGNNGYRSNSRKDRENYAVDLHYKLTPAWQLNADVRYLNVDDNLAHLGRWESITAERDDAYRSLTVDALNEDSSGNYVRAYAHYQTFEEKVRSRYLFLRQKIDNYKFGCELVRPVRQHTAFFESQLVFNRVTIEPGHDYYTRINVLGGARLFPEERLSWVLSGNYLYDWGDASRVGGTAEMILRSIDSLTLRTSVGVSHIPPTDMARFLKPWGLEIAGDGPSLYYHNGDRSLKPTLVAKASAEIRYSLGRYDLTATGRACRIDNMVIWQAYEGESGGLYQPEAHEANLYALTGTCGIRFLGSAKLKSSYTYTRIDDKNSDGNLSLMPRHNIHASVSWKQHVRKLKLDAFPSIDAEYHSTNFGNYLNTGDLGDYILLHARISLRIKSFNFYYTMENIANKKYQTVFGYPSSRRVWWGLRWLFID
ncbi:MAG: hypothetical protein KKG33_08580 [candidate division Zixibacteria bacterium]|nr:hypothetical protein [candidate division Zixibacteria bacterium]MBU1471906.1 hypothetical protein [candidate division Zixibacteria bacterium]MBU2625602.1 hypothetical protein [candidate division Zixibacteria bacterium]